MDDLNSEFETDSEAEAKRRKRKDLAEPDPVPHKRKADKAFFIDEQSKEGGRRVNNFNVDVVMWHNPRQLCPSTVKFVLMLQYTRHKQLINEYYLYYPGATKHVFQRDTSKDRNDYDVIRENHKFLWKSTDDDSSWEKKLAKRYYDKLFKEYCIADLSRYKENKKVAGLCPDCSYKLNYHHKKKKVEKKPKKKDRLPKKEEVEWRETRASSSKDMPPPPIPKQDSGDVKKEAEEAAQTKAAEATASEVWKQPQVIEEEKSREEEFDEFLEDLFL